MTTSRATQIAAVVLVLGGIWYFESQRTPAPPTSTPVEVTSRASVDAKAGTYDRAKELAGISEYLNTEPFTIQELIGKQVILVDFWTYSCINCQRTIPYLNAWHERYGNQGLTIVGVHTPEFDFEKSTENVRKAIERFGVQYRVAQDNDFATWRAYRNRWWPRKYLIDIDGYIVYDHIGEGGYEETERKIQELLAERAQRLALDGGNEMPAPFVAEVQTDTNQPRSPEIYFGSGRNTEFVGNVRGGAPGEQRAELSKDVRRDRFYLDGTWRFTPEYVESVSNDGRLRFRYRAREVYMVASAGVPLTVRVLRDGVPIGEAGGADVRASELRIGEERLYHIVSDPEGYGEHTLEFVLEESGFRAYTFTFG